MKPTENILKMALIAAIAAVTLFAAKYAIPSSPATEPNSASQKSPVPAHYSLAVKFDSPKYFLGENVLLDFIVQNTGTTPIVIGIGGDYRGTWRQTRFKIKATAEDGSTASDPHPNAEMSCMGGMGGGKSLAPTDTFTQSLALLDYARVLKPGKYKIAVSHDLGWDVGTNLPTAVGQVEFVMPSPDQASEVVERMYKLPKDHSYNLSGERKVNMPISRGSHTRFIWHRFCKKLKPRRQIKQNRLSSGSAVFHHPKRPVR